MNNEQKIAKSEFGKGLVIDFLNLIKKGPLQFMPGVSWLDYLSEKGTFLFRGNNMSYCSLGKLFKISFCSD